MIFWTLKLTAYKLTLFQNLGWYSIGKSYEYNEYYLIQCLLVMNCKQNALRLS